MEFKKIMDNLKVRKDIDTYKAQVLLETLIAWKEILALLKIQIVIMLVRVHLLKQIQ